MLLFCSVYDMMMLDCVIHTRSFGSVSSHGLDDDVSITLT